jgi:hypothetical protein
MTRIFVTGDNHTHSATYKDEGEGLRSVPQHKREICNVDNGSAAPHPEVPLR